MWKRESKRARQQGINAEREEGTEGTYKKRVRTREIDGKAAVFIFILGVRIFVSVRSVCNFDFIWSVCK